MYKTTILAFAFFGLLLCPGYPEHIDIDGAKVGKWTMDLVAAQKLAKEKNLPMFVNYTGSDWCHWCKLMDKSVFAKPKWEQYSRENLVLVMIDFPNVQERVPQKYRDRNRSLAQKYNVTGYPTYIIMDSDGKTELGRLGASRGETPASFQKKIEGVVRLRQWAIDKKVAQLSKEQGQKYLELIKELKKTKAELDEWLKSRPQTTESNLNRFDQMNKRIDELEDNIAAFHK